MDIADGVDDAFDQSLRSAITVASRVGEQLARQREQRLRDRAAAEQQQARELEARYEAERAAARARLRLTEQPQWWDKATPEAIAENYAVAVAWKDDDEVARTAAERIRQEAAARYGIDVDAVTPAGTIAEQEAKEERLRQELDTQKARALRDQGLGELAAAERETGAQREQLERSGGRQLDESDKDWDSADSRGARAASLENVADGEAVAAQLHADRGQGRSPADAVAHGPSSAPKARKAGASTSSRQREVGRSR